MRKNPVKSKLAQGEAAFGIMVFEFFSPGLPQIAQEAGADFILFDMEHSGADVGHMREQIANCRGLDIVPMVRVPTAQYHFIARLLDLGAMGIMLPMVETKEQAEFVVSCARYPPLGIRGAAFGVAAHDDYSDGDIAQKILAAHARTMIICLIETPKGVANIDAIAAVPGVDVCWIGHFDLTNFSGIPGQFDDPGYLRSVGDVVSACRKYGKTAGFMATDESWSRDYYARGFRMIAASFDVKLIKEALRDQIGVLRECARTDSLPL